MWVTRTIVKRLGDPLLFARVPLGCTRWATVVRPSGCAPPPPGPKDDGGPTPPRRSLGHLAPVSRSPPVGRHTKHSRQFSMNSSRCWLNDQRFFFYYYFPEDSAGLLMVRDRFHGWSILGDGLSPHSPSPRLTSRPINNEILCFYFRIVHLGFSRILIELTSLATGFTILPGLVIFFLFIIIVRIICRIVFSGLPLQNSSVMRQIPIFTHRRMLLA